MAGSSRVKALPLIMSLWIVVALMAAIGNQGAMAQSGCTTALVSLSPCLNYINGNQTTPSQGCCSSLSSVVTNNAACLCQLLGGNNSLGIPINQTRALALPAACKVTTPPVSQCKGSGAPASSPSPTAPEVPAASPSPTVSEAPPTSPSPKSAEVPATSPSGTSSNSPTTETSPSSNPTQNNAASDSFKSPAMAGFALSVLLAAVVM